MSMLNLRHLIDDMKANLRVITAFDFSYKGKNYVVVCEDISKQPDEEKPKKYKYYIAKLTFIDYNDESRTLTVLANTKYFDGVSTAQFRAFFGIEYGNNLGDIFQQFYSYFSKSIPEQVPKNLNKTQTSSCVKQLNQKKGETDGQYCFNVFRNGKDSKQRQNIVLVTMLIKQDFYAQLCLIISKKIQQLVFALQLINRKKRKI